MSKDMDSRHLSTSLPMTDVVGSCHWQHHVAKNGNDSNQGTADYPLLTIQASAKLTLPGVIVIVHEGKYREEIISSRGGGLNKTP